MGNEFHKQAEKLGLDNRMMQCIEEMSELTKALCKWKRYYSNDPTLRQNIYQIRENVIEEIADTEYCLEQLKYLLGAKGKVEQIKEEKLKRTELMLRERG